jgi:hypothetical protein
MTLHIDKASEEVIPTTTTDNTKVNKTEEK